MTSFPFQGWDSSRKAIEGNSYTQMTHSFYYPLGCPFEHLVYSSHELLTFDFDIFEVIVFICLTM